MPRARRLRRRKPLFPLMPSAGSMSPSARSHAHASDTASSISATPFKKTAKTVIGYLEKAEMDALLAQPDRRTPLGDRDHSLLLFLYNSGARAEEAAKLTIDHLQLGSQSS